ncbi:MAG: bifunctional methionine sulfoxide reductase B/A protein [Candidatus Neomarinimicrobiota bacterium]
MLTVWSLVAALAGQENMNSNPLTPEEEYVIVHKGTERPFSGEYTDHIENGVYICRRCDAPLFRSINKFDSHCGWPSFDDMIDGAVKQAPDADGRRTEILCANCGGHLGHVFSGEEFTSKNTRHCVNSIALKFIGESPTPQTDRAIFASGCFWGTEYHLSKLDGVISTTVGYTGGHKGNPTYQQVSAGNTGHAEAIEVIFDPGRVTYEELARLFFETHDPIQLNRQGPDIGHQYRSAVFYLNDEQKAVAEKLIGLLREKDYDVVTEVTAASTFWEAENYHQDYYATKGALPYCHFYEQKF